MSTRDTNLISASITTMADSTMRLIQVMAAFKARHAQWPVAVDIDRGMLEGLKSDMLTALGYSRQCGLLKVTSRVKGDVVARGTAGSQIRVSLGERHIETPVNLREVPN